jgi:hypothetical protein
MLVIFTISILILTYLFYESRSQSTNNVTSRFNAYPETIEILYKLSLVILVVISKGSEGKWIIAVFMSFLTCLLYVGLEANFRFYNRSAELARKIAALLTCWGFCVMLLTLLLASLFQFSGIELFLLGIPLILVCQSISNDLFWTALPQSYFGINNAGKLHEKVNALICLALTKSIEIVIIKNR